MTAVALSHVSKTFGEVRAVDDLTFSVERGEVFGFLGGNGAGKTTSLRMMLDIIRPSAGTIEILGKPPGRDNAAAIGFLPEERGLYRQMTALDTIVYFGRLKGMSAADARTQAKALLDRFELSAHHRTTIDKLSKGMSQKVQLATALVNRPRLLLLDEPFSGLDPVNQRLLEDEILGAARSGATVIFSTHVMQHAERLCDRLLLLGSGQKRFEGTQDEARAQLPATLLVVTRQSPEAWVGVARAQPTGAQDVDGWRAWDVHLAPGVEPSSVLERCVANGTALRRFDEQRATLHDAFLHLVGSENARP